ncbi:hypothetical protein ACFQJ5_09535 [Halomicroarcula sp. GCM10025324]|jgi:hypothetical protein|nr:hypothetical protein [Halomicroarcula sp. ZS-22-S1]
MSDAVYLVQNNGETRIELDEESYDRIIDSPRATVIGHRRNGPIVKIR